MILKRSCSKAFYHIRAPSDINRTGRNKTAQWHFGKPIAESKFASKDGR